jgi:RecQ family ATP-dependent DNA helicase
VAATSAERDLDPDRLLAAVFGHPAFRAGQREAVAAALARRDVLVVMPTGSGKSLCFQLPALGALELTLVVSPLVALMQDQVAGLRAAGHDDVAALHSGGDRDDADATLAALRDGSLRLLYVAPERFASARFRSALAARRVDLLVVDEAHCLSEWGHDFRPDYGRLARVRDELGAPPTMALTATATPRVEADVARRLELRDPVSIRTGADRPNLVFDVLHAPSPKRRLALLRESLAPVDARPAIVYARSRRAVEELAAELGALRYHAGLPAGERRAAQEEFTAADDRVIVCTNAFGMGVDKPNVRAVWHWNMPGSPEAYYQEAGRAGRDGAPARCVLLYAPSDRGLIGRFIREARFTSVDVDRLLAALAERAEPGSGAFAVASDELDRLGPADAVPAWVAAAEAVGALELEPGSAAVYRGRLRLRRLGTSRRGAVEQRARALERWRWDQLDALQRYAEGGTCRRRTLLSYLGDRAEPAPEGRCCDVCDPPADAPARPAPVGDLRAAVVEVAGTAAPSVGRSGVDGILRGLESYRDRYGDHPRFAAAEGQRPAAVRGAIDAAVEGGLLVSTDGRYPLLLPPGAERLRGAPGTAPRPRATPAAAPAGADGELFAALREWRREAAAAAGVPAYVIAHDRTLAAIANARPATPAALLAIPGIGPTFVERHAAGVLALVADAPSG